MKLKLPAKFGQRDPQWAGELLGYNTNPVYSIGGFGCLITSFGCYINKNPHDVNQLLKANSGYTAGSGNFIWSKCSVLGLNQVYQSPYYSDPVTSQGLTKMRSLLDEGRPLITHIDFDPRDADDDQHWLIVFGHDDNNVFYAHDPWTNTDITLDVYGGVQRCVYEWRAYDKILPLENDVDCQQELDRVRQERDRNWGYFTTLCDIMAVPHSIDVAKGEEERLIKLEDAYVEKARNLDEAQQKIDDLETKLANLSFNQTELVSENVTLKEKVDDADKKIQEQGVEISNLLASIQELKGQILTPVYKGWKATLVKLIGSLPF